MKIACLSYTSSPITYDEGSGAKIEVKDLMRVKDSVLKKAEFLNAKLNLFLVDHSSKYGILQVEPTLSKPLHPSRQVI